MDLAIRDIRIAFELGCLGSELLDFLLEHHVDTDDEVTADGAAAAVLERSVNALYDPNVPGCQKKLFVAKLKEDLEQIQRARNKKRIPSDESVALIEEHVINLVNVAQRQEGGAEAGGGRRQAQDEPAAEVLLDEDERHFIYPSLSSCVDVVVDKRGEGRKIVAQMELDVGEVVAIEEPNTILFCPDSNLASLSSSPAVCSLLSEVTFTFTSSINQLFMPLSLTAPSAQESLPALFFPLNRASSLRGLLRRVLLLVLVQGSGHQHLPQVRVQDEALRDAALHGG